jgi:hypothetical protein
MSTIYTVGHSTRTVEEFIGLLKCFGIDLVADIRTVPKSRHNPQFHIDRLPGSLASAGIDYRHLPGLGGLRRPKRVNQHRMAKRVLPRVRRLHEYCAFPGRARRAHCPCCTTYYRHHVRRSRLLAVSPCSCRRRSACSRRRCSAHRRRWKADACNDEQLREARRITDHLSLNMIDRAPWVVIMLVRAGGCPRR